ncbi:MAG: Na(+)-translocating NADH-quinone reductase subunit A [Gammaproteobacteria bacterium]|nr:Na(+)-translocating NADH-quinone reductase subunit A [Gammaproteobacteria bacterium]MDH3415779.1 Na(+)-translocating NADH-quinone reductase subunit A [Gammaproteobacteria bacterium]
MRITIKKGLDVPISGSPDPVIENGRDVGSVALLGWDTPGLKPSMAVAEGDSVKLGQVLYRDKRNPDVPFTAPGSGVVAKVHRGERRALQSVVIKLDGSDEETFPVVDAGKIDALDAAEVRRVLVKSGFWNSLRSRPFGRIPQPDAKPNSIFVTAMDTNPLALNPAMVIAEDNDAFVTGLRLIDKLSDGPTFVCTAPDTDIPCPDIDTVRHVEFAGPHPAGLVGTHIHFLDPVSVKKTVWHIGYQDTIAVGRLFLTGRIPTERVIAVGGPMVTRPRILRTRRGASTTDLLANELRPGNSRVVSGSVLAGHRAAGALAWLGRYRNQLSVLQEGSPREFLGWMRPGRNKYSALRAYASTLLHKGDYDFTTSQNGSPRAMVATGSFERIMPLDILPSVLLKALLVRDTDGAQELGCLELDEEDLALCSFVCNGKYNYGPHLRKALDEIEANG